MSISDEILRLQTAKSDLATSIANKGVTVPSSATLDDYAALVDSIQTGGGGTTYGTKIEYLESSGTQWIDTKFYAVSGNIQHYKARFDSSGSGIVMSIDKTVSSNFDRNLFAFSNGYADFEKLNYYADRTPSYYTRYTYQQGTDYEIYYDNRGTSLIGKINGETLTNQSLPGTLSGNNSVKIFMSDYSGGLRVGRIYWLKLYDSNGVLSRDFVPIRFGSVGYMYDKVSGQLFGNAGTGDFILGNDIT